MLLLLLMTSCKTQFRGLFYAYNDDVYNGVVDANVLDPLALSLPNPYDSGPFIKPSRKLTSPQRNFYNNLVDQNTIYEVNGIKPKKTKKGKKGSDGGKAKKKKGWLSRLGLKKKKKDEVEGEKEVKNKGKKKRKPSKRKKKKKRK